jgi:hypothetical protein
MWKQTDLNARKQTRVNSMATNDNSREADCSGKTGDSLGVDLSSINIRPPASEKVRQAARYESSSKKAHGRAKLYL